MAEISGPWPALLVLLLTVTACSRQKGEPSALVVDTRIRYQTIEGFGAAVNAWAPELRAFQEDEAFPRFFVQELGANVLRVDLWHGSVPERARWQDIHFADFVLDGEKNRGGFYARMAKRLVQASAGQVRIIGSVWSPPAWMKENLTHGNGNSKRENFALSIEDLESKDGPLDPASAEREPHLYRNRLRRDRYEHFAKALVEWTRLYRSLGVELYAISPQNEPRFSHWFESCVYTPSELASLLSVIVAMFEREHEPVPRLFAPETMAHDTVGNRLYLGALFGPEAVGPRLHALASHGYIDGYKADADPHSPARFFDLAREHGKPVWSTEGGTGRHGWPEALDGLASSLLSSLLDGNASLVTTWQVVDRTAGEHSLTSLSGPTKKTRVAQQFFRLLPPGTRRVDLREEVPSVRAAAFVNQASGRLVVLALNRGDGPRTLEVRAEPGMAISRPQSRLTSASHDFTPGALSFVGPRTFVLPARAIASIEWSLGP